jgi:plasmid stabilization system protein ParE
MIVFLTPEAEADIAEATSWLGEQSNELPSRFESVVAKAIADALAFPEAYPLVHRSARRILTGTFPYAIYYLIEPEMVVVFGVIHQARHPSTWQRRM